VNFAVNQRTGRRIAVLSPMNRELALQRFREWEAILDGAPDDPHAQVRALEKSKELWREMQTEQQWKFEGWMADDLKTVLGQDAKPRYMAVGGDMNVDPVDAHLWGK
jgi:hypothetical protein